MAIIITVFFFLFTELRQCSILPAAPALAWFSHILCLPLVTLSIFLSPSLPLSLLSILTPSFHPSGSETGRFYPPEKVSSFSLRQLCPEGWECCEWQHGRGHGYLFWLGFCFNSFPLTVLCIFSSNHAGHTWVKILSRCSRPTHDSFVLTLGSNLIRLALPFNTLVSCRLFSLP